MAPQITIREDHPLPLGLGRPEVGQSWKVTDIFFGFIQFSSELGVQVSYVQHKEFENVQRIPAVKISMRPRVVERAGLGIFHTSHVFCAVCSVFLRFRAFCSGTV